MNQFLKYMSIENHYRSEYINKALAANPNLEKCTYVLQEKIHGANISFLFRPNEDFKVFSRNQEIDPSSNAFNGLADVLARPEYVRLVEWFRRVCEAQGYSSIRLYGEMFGGNIQKGVWYGEKKQILFYDMMINDAFMAVTNLVDTMMCFDQVDDWFVPHVHVARDLKEALEFAEKVDEQRSLLTPSDYTEDSGKLRENVLEGVVIKPYFDAEMDHYDRPFYLKLKGEKFKEKQKAKKPKNVKDEDPKLAELREEFNSYLTDNRLAGVFGKWGKIIRDRDIGVYISYMMDDAKEDFMKDFGEELEKYSKQDVRSLFSQGGKIIVPMLKDNM